LYAACKLTELFLYPYCMLTVSCLYDACKLTAHAACTQTVCSLRAYCAGKLTAACKLTVFLPAKARTQPENNPNPAGKTTAEKTPGTNLLLDPGDFG